MNETTELIIDELGLNIFGMARKNARRSTIQSYKTGAVIFNRQMQVVSFGTSHVHIGSTYTEDHEGKRSVHAEDDALDKIYYIKDKSHLSIFVYTLNRNCTTVVQSSRPCKGCASRLLSAGLRHVFYLEKDNAGSWRMIREKPARIVKRDLGKE